MSLESFRRKSLKDKIEDIELGKKIDELTAEKVDKAEKGKSGVRASKKHE